MKSLFVSCLVLTLVACTPGLAKLKTVAVFDLPESKTKVQITVETRWRGGHLEYRTTAAPMIPALAKINSLSDKANVLEVRLLDKEGFTVSTIVPLFELGHLIENNLIEERWNELSEADFKRIVSAKPFWRFSDALKRELAK